MTGYVGNDVVDLLDPRCADKSSDLRFLDRVFTDREIEIIDGSERPDEALWVAWAAKEAAFKVVTKLAGSPPPFRHAAFEFLPAPPGPTPAAPVRVVEGRVEYRESGIPVAGEIEPDRIHLVAWYPGADEPPGIRSRIELLPEPGDPNDSRHMDGLQDQFTAREWRSIHRPASAQVRLNARKHLAEILGVDERDLEIVCDDGLPGRMPPYVLISGERWRGDVSLSHHGRFLAWAFLDPAPERTRTGA